MTALTFYLLDLLYSFSNESSKIVLVGRSLSHSHQRIYVLIEDINPYIYISSEKQSIDEITSFIQKNSLISSWVKNTDLSEIVKNRYFRNKEKIVIKIMGSEPFKVPEIKKIFDQNSFECFEYDIPFVHRFLIDTN